MNSKLLSLIGVFVVAVIVVLFLPTITNQIQNVDTPTYIETDTAVNDNLTDEVLTLDNTPVAINYITVNGTELTVTTEYTFVGGVVTILGANSNTGDTIVTSYTYDDPGTDTQVSLLNLMPFLVVTGVALIFIYRKYK